LGGRYPPGVITPARVNQLLSYRGKLKMGVKREPLTPVEETAMRLRLDRTLLFPPRSSEGRKDRS
jgi:hypothetical protein